MFPLNLPVYLSLVLLADHYGHVTYLLMFELYFQVRALFLTPSCQCDCVIVTNTYIYWGSGIAFVPPAHCTCFVPMPSPCVMFLYIGNLLHIHRDGYQPIVLRTIVCTLHEATSKLHLSLPLVPHLELTQASVWMDGHLLPLLLFTTPVLVP